MSYVARWRMSVACRQLCDTDNSLAAIADGVGYQDLAAFSRAFKELVGESPSSMADAAEQTTLTSSGQFETMPLICINHDIFAML